MSFREYPQPDACKAWMPTSPLPPGTSPPSPPMVCYMPAGHDGQHSNERRPSTLSRRWEDDARPAPAAPQPQLVPPRDAFELGERIRAGVYTGAAAGQPDAGGEADGRDPDEWCADCGQKHSNCECYPYDSDLANVVASHLPAAPSAGQDTGCTDLHDTLVNGVPLVPADHWGQDTERLQGEVRRWVESNWRVTVYVDQMDRLLDGPLRQLIDQRDEARAQVQRVRAAIYRHQDNLTPTQRHALHRALDEP